MQVLVGFFLNLEGGSRDRHPMHDISFKVKANKVAHGGQSEVTTTIYGNKARFIDTLLRR